jgi:hypothetical protein
MRSAWWAVPAVLAGAAALGLAQERKADPVPAEPSAAVKEMIATADKGLAECIAEKRYGLGHSDEIARWSARTVAAARLTGDPARLKTALEAHLATLRRLEDHSKERVKTGDAVELEALTATYDRALAEVELERVK